MKFSFDVAGRRPGSLLSLALLMVLAGSSTALAGSSAEALNVPIQQGNEDCGIDHPELSVIGHVNFVRNKSKLQVQFVLDGADANTTYAPYLYDEACNQLVTYSQMVTDSNGDASFTAGLYGVKGKRIFFATVKKTSTGIYSDTPMVDLR